MAKKKPTVLVTPYFNLLIIINGGILLLAAAGMVFGSWDDPMPKGKERLFNACEYAFLITVGAFVGLLGGRAGRPDKIEEEPAVPAVQVPGPPPPMMTR